MSNWKKYGGLSHVESQNSISAYSLSVDLFTLRQAYFGTFDICGELHVSGNALVDTDVRCNSVTARQDISCNQLFVATNSNHLGNMNITGNVTVSSGNVFVSSGNVDISNNIHLGKKLFLGNTGLYLNGTDISGNIGINTAVPKSALDFQSTKSFMLNLETTSATNYSILSKTAGGDGVLVYADPTVSRLDFFVDGSANLSNAPDARLAYTPGGNFTIDVSSNTAILSNVSLSNRAAQTTAHLLGETAIVYDNSAGTYQYPVYQNAASIRGNALTLVANDASSVTFMNVVSSDKKGIALGGGAYPNNTTRAMGTIGLVDSWGNYLPAVNLVDASSNVRNKFALGINTYAPEIDNYILNVNGPTHLKNGQISITKQTDIEIYRLGVFAANTNYAIAVGSPTTTDLTYNDAVYKYRQEVYYTVNGGESWTDISTDLSNGIHNTSLEQAASGGGPRYINDVFLYDASLAFMCANGIVNYSNSSGAKWYGISNLNGTRNYYSVYALASRVYLADTTGGITYFDYTGAIYTDYDGVAAIGPGFTAIGYSGNPMLSGYGSDLYLAAGNTIYRLSNLGGSVTYSTLFTNSYGPYRSIYTSNGQNAIAVGNGVITWTNNAFSTRTDINVVGAVFNGVHIIDASNAIAVGNGGLIKYSTDGYATWKTVNAAILNSSGNGNTLIDAGYNVTNVRCLDNNQFYVTKTISAYTSTTTAGNTSIFHCYVPELFNPTNNFVLDISGVLRTSGDLNVNDGGRIRTNNSTFYLLDTCANVIRMGGDASNVYIGNAASSLTTVNANLATLRDASFNGNVVVGGKTQMLGNTTFTNSYVFSSYYDSANSSGDINIGGLNSAQLGLPVNPGVRNIKIGNFNGSVDMSCNIYVGGASDKLVFGGSIYQNTSMNIGPFVYINYLAALNSSPGCGIYVGENGFKGAGYFAVSNDMGGFAVKSTKSANVLKLDVSNLVYNGAGAFNQGIVTLSKLTPGIGVDASYSLGVGTIDLSNVFLKNWTLSSVANNVQTIDSSMAVIGTTAIGKSTFLSNANLDVSGNVLVSSRLGVGNTAVNSAYVLDVLGNTNLGGNVNVTGLIAGQANVAVNKSTATAGYALDVSGNVNVAGNIVSSTGAKLTGGNLAVNSGNVSINRTLANAGYALDVSGNTNVSGNVTVGGGLVANTTQTINFGTNAPTMSGANIGTGTIPLTALNGGIGSTGNVAINKASVTSGYALDVSGNTNVTGNVTIRNGLTVSAGGLTVTAGTVSFPSASISVNAISGLSTALAGINSTGNVAINKASASTGYALDISGNTNVSGNVTIQSVLGYAISSYPSTYATSSGDIMGTLTSNLSYGYGITGITTQYLITYTPNTTTQYYTFVFNYNYTSNPTGFSMYVYANYVSAGSPGTVYNIGVVSPGGLSGSISSTYLITGGMSSGIMAIGFYSAASMTTTGVSFYVLTGNTSSFPTKPLIVGGNTTVTGSIDTNGLVVNSGKIVFPPSSISANCINGLSNSLAGINSTGNVAINKASVTSGYALDVSGNTNVTGNVTIGNGLTVSAGTVSLPLASIADAALSSNIPKLNAICLFTGGVSFGGVVTYYGDSTMSSSNSGSFVRAYYNTGMTLTLPTTNTFAGCYFTFFGANAFNITCSSGTIYGAISGATVTKPANNYLSLWFDGSNWIAYNTDIYVAKTNLNNTFTAGITATAAQTITFGSNAPTMSGANITSGTIPIAALNGGIGSTGNVAINKATTKGNTQLDVNGNLVANCVWLPNTTSGLNFGGSPNDPGTTIYSKIYDNANLHLWTDDWLYIDIGGTSPTNAGTTPSGYTNVVSANATSFGIAVGAYVSGNLAVGQTSVTAGYALDVAGNAKVSGNLTTGNGLTVSAGAVSLPLASIADGALSSNVMLLGTPQNITAGKAFSYTTSGYDLLKVNKYGSSSYWVVNSSADMGVWMGAGLGTGASGFGWNISNGGNSIFANIAINRNGVSSTGYVLDVSGNTNVTGNLVVSNGFTVSGGAVFFPAGSINPAAISGGVGGSIAGINSTGNVAINKASAATNSQLDVAGNIIASGSLLLSNTNNAGLNFSNGVGGATSKIYNNGDIHVWTDDKFYLDIGGSYPVDAVSAPTGFSTILYANATGVAINKTSVNSGYSLDVSGNVLASGNLSANNVAIGSLGSAGYKLYVNGSAYFTGPSSFVGTTTISGTLSMYNLGYPSVQPYWDVAVDNNGAFTIYHQNNGLGVFVGANATAWSPNSSDERTKRDITNVESSLEKLMKINPVYYNYKNDSPDTKPRVGFIAQNIQSQFPVATLIGPYNEIIKDYPLTISPIDLIPYMVKSIQEQQKQIQNQQQQIQEQQKQIDDLKSIVNHLMSLLNP